MALQVVEGNWCGWSFVISKYVGDKCRFKCRTAVDILGNADVFASAKKWQGDERYVQLKIHETGTSKNSKFDFSFYGISNWVLAGKQF